VRRDVLRQDVEQATDRPLTVRTLLLGLLLQRSVQILFLHRLAEWLHDARVPGLPGAFQRLAQVAYGADLDYRATIGPGLVLRHPVGIVVGRDVVIGSRVRLFQNVTLGNRMSGSESRPDGMPTLEDDVHVYAGAVVLGPITIGARSVIGANAVVTRSCPPDSRITAPASRITTRDSA
jgi:serine O-acetyltransferase